MTLILSHPELCQCQTWPWEHICQHWPWRPHSSYHLPLPLPKPPASLTTGKEANCMCPTESREQATSQRWHQESHRQRQRNGQRLRKIEMSLRGHEEAAQCLRLHSGLLMLFLLFICINLTSLQTLWGSDRFASLCNPSSQPGAQGTWCQRKWVDK